jgi:hypothetical protein
MSGVHEAAIAFLRAGGRPGLGEKQRNAELRRSRELMQLYVTQLDSMQRLNIRVPISCLTAFHALKPLGIARFWAGRRARASPLADVSAPCDLPSCCPNYRLTYPLKPRLLALTRFSAVQLRLPRDRKLLRVVVHTRQYGRRLKGIVQP